MNKNNLITRAFLHALGVVVYVILFAWAVNNLHQLFGPGPTGWPGFALFLIVFIVSACITGSLVLLKPVLLYMEGHKKEALHMFAYTVLFLVLTLIVGFFVSLYGAPRYTPPMLQVERSLPN